MKNPKSIIGKNIKRLRQELGLSQDRLSKAVQVFQSNHTLSSFNGHRL